MYFYMFSQRTDRPTKDQFIYTVPWTHKELILKWDLKKHYETNRLQIDESDNCYLLLVVKDEINQDAQHVMTKSNDHLLYF